MSAETLLLFSTGRLGTSFQRCFVRHSSEEWFGHPQAHALSLQAVEHFGALQPAHYATQSPQHRAAEAILPSSQTPTLNQSGLQTECNPVSGNTAPPPDFDAAELLI